MGFPRHARHEPDPEPVVQVPDTPAEAVYLAALGDARAAIADARLALHVVIARLPAGSGTRERLIEALSRLSDALILAEVPR